MTGKKTLRWDEANLDYNEENKQPTMKIDEPPTPFNFDYCDDEPVDDDDGKETAPRSKVVLVDTSDKAEKAPALSFAAELQGKMAAISSDPTIAQPAVVASAEEEEAKKAAFAANRAAHYNMAAALRGHVTFDSDESDGEPGEGSDLVAAAAESAEGGEGDAADARARKEQFALKRKAFYLARDQEAAERAKQMQEDMKETADSPSDEGGEK